MAGGSTAAEAEMDLDVSRGSGVASFEFAFDSPNFSDRVLRIKIVGSENAPGSSSDMGRESIGDARENRGNKDQSVDSSEMVLGTAVLREKTIYINSAILASRSPFFLKNLIRRTTDPTLLLDILMAADKFEVLSCMKHCSQLLTSLPMTTESALLYIDHPCSTSLAAEIQRVIGVAKDFITDQYKDFDKFRHEVMNISLAGIEAIFSSSDLRVKTEDELYFFMLEWARARCPGLEERRKILSSRLLPLVRFSHMTCATLRKVLACTDNDVDHEQVTARVGEALLHIAYPTEIEGALSADVREYKLKPVKAVALDGLCPHVIVYLDLTRKECSRLFPSEIIFSHSFYLAGQEFLLSGGCSELDEASNSYSFGLFLLMNWDPECSKSVTLDCEFAAKRKPPGEFVRGCDDLFHMPWSTFIADDSLFIDGVLHLRADLTVVMQPESQS